jgi:hypothetical protein
MCPGLPYFVGSLGVIMPEKQTLERAHKDAREGKSPSTQRGEFVREEMHHSREGKHGARSTRQAIAIGLSKARRAGVRLQTPWRGKASARTRSQASRDLRRGQSAPGKASRTRSRATSRALKGEGPGAAFRKALGGEARSAVRGRSAAERQRAAMKAVRTKRSAGRAGAVRKAARSRTRTT